MEIHYNDFPLNQLTQFTIDVIYIYIVFDFKICMYTSIKLIILIFNYRIEFCKNLYVIEAPVSLYI